ncbi:dubious [Schizosaccharomyces pombe]|uniref:Putative uncharacterized protein P35G2.17 n=1 Tax=Schizosaccharomyces pombe (strain 972 / ATCC 24843) TaxID=284812 RepID=YN8H_SCHPO|nr:uncharacterized protein SPBP35G2.17 [Schizosaccharomyces pombe]G2TRS6.1 RecName: Full=Putative uncharacterized protein P35G2.17 [Schizosaccharomyces pombe 972h-]CCD31357.1 dubious [Schizosaccharomyces pombe]|eukprot:NP_001343147.1 uncharacterized protein SPBP35G2.17 [Schizosaccharomyces pombe]
MVREFYVTGRGRKLLPTVFRIKSFHGIVRQCVKQQRDFTSFLASSPAMGVAQGQQVKLILMLLIETWETKHQSCHSHFILLEFTHLFVRKFSQIFFEFRLFAHLLS